MKTHTTYISEPSLSEPSLSEPSLSDFQLSESLLSAGKMPSSSTEALVFVAVSFLSKLKIRKS